jgi:hypothetical protein
MIVPGLCPGADLTEGFVLLKDMQKCFIGLGSFGHFLL